jgi:hypothetical protein
MTIEGIINLMVSTLNSLGVLDYIYAMFIASAAVGIAAKLRNV